MSTDQIELWHKRARPNPTEDDFNVQLGCHFEEIEEMMSTIDCSESGHWEYIRHEIFVLANALKAGKVKTHIADRKEFLDSLADQVVTAIGAGHCAGMKTAGAVAAVNRSNYSKFDKNGMPIFNEHGKVTKGPDYQPPNLDGLY